MVENEKRGQVAIFIILGVLLVTVVVLFFLLQSPQEKRSLESSSDVKGTLQDCVREAVQKKLGEALANGGRLGKQRGIMYQGSSFTFLCTTTDYYSPCYNLFPLQEYDLEESLQNETSGDVRACFDGLTLELEDRGYSVQSEAVNYSIDILPGRVDLLIYKKMRVSREGASQSYEDFSTRLLSSAQELIRTTRDVIGSESTFCTFEYMGYMNLNPRLDIRRTDYKEHKLYWIKDRVSGEEIKFAVRTCVAPPGI